MALASFFTLLGVWVVAIAAPGPDTLLLLRLGWQRRRSAQLAAVGIMLGNTLWITLALGGLATLVGSYPLVLRVLQGGGAVFLAYLGWGALRSAWRGWGSVTTQPAYDAPAGTTAPAGWAALRLGLFTNLANPKALVFFGAVFAQFLVPGMSLVSMVLVALSMVVVGLAWFVGFATMVGSLAGPLQRYGHWLDLVAGFIFLILAAALGVAVIHG